MSRRQTKGPRSMAYHEAGHAVDVSILDLVRKELRAGEKLIWADQAGPIARAKTKTVAFLWGIPSFVFFAILVAIALEYGNWIFIFFGIFCVIGAGMVLSPLWSYIEARSRWIIYAITDQRLLQIRLFPLHQVNSYGPEDITGIERTTKSDGSGNIVYRREMTDITELAIIIKRGFYGIREVVRVEEEIIKLRKSRR